MVKTGPALTWRLSLALFLGALLGLAGCTNPVSDGPGQFALNALPGVGKATITWPPVVGATGYVLEWSTDQAFPSEGKTTVADAASPFILDDLDPGARRYFRVAAVLPSGRGPWAQTSVELADRWTWSWTAQPVRYTTQDVKSFDLADGSYVVFITTHYLTFDFTLRLSLDGTGMTWEGSSRQTDSVEDGVTPPVVTQTTLWKRGGLPVGSTVSLTERNDGTGWVALVPVENHVVTSNADRTLLVVDGDGGNPFILVP